MLQTLCISTQNFVWLRPNSRFIEPGDFINKKWKIAKDQQTSRPDLDLDPCPTRMGDERGGAFSFSIASGFNYS